MTESAAGPPIVVGRYALHGDIASGGMATIHIGRLMGPVGFARTVAIKRLHPNFAKDPEFVSMFLDEARLAARIRHPNVVSILDVVAVNSELLLVMDYIAGESFARLMGLEHRRGRRVPLSIVAKVMTEVLSGLHAAHEVTSDRGLHLGVVHRDVSPQNILVGQDGISHLIDFGVAKATGRMQTTQNGQIKGKLAYMAPEQIISDNVDRRVDVYAAGIVLWEALTGRRAFKGADPQIMFEVLASNLPSPSSVVSDIPPALDALVMKAIAREPAARFSTALEMCDAIEEAVRSATSREVARWVEQVAAESLTRRARVLAEVEGITQISARYEPPVEDDRPTPLPDDQLPTRLLAPAPVVATPVASAPVVLPTPSVIIQPEPSQSGAVFAPEAPPRSNKALFAGVAVGAILGGLVVVRLVGSGTAGAASASPTIATTAPSASAAQSSPSASADPAPTVSASSSAQPTVSAPSKPVRPGADEGRKNRLKSRGF